MDARSASRGHVAALDGLRGLAAVIVVMAHCVIAFDWPPAVRHAIFASPLALVLNSEGAVMLFFVLSGFVLSASLERSPGIPGVAQYYVKRVFRIHPPFMVGLLFAWAASFFYVVVPEGAGLSPWLAKWAGIHLRPLRLAFALTFPGGAYGQMPVGWTLTIELVFSFLLPLMVWVARRTHPALLLLPAAWLLTRSAQHATFWHAFEFSLGILAYGERARLGRLVGAGGPAGSALVVAAGLALSCVHLVRGWPGEPERIVTAGLGSFLLVIAATSVPALARALGARPVAFLGRISYSLYLLHFPVLILLAPLFTGAPPTVGRAVGLVATVLAVTCALSVPCHRFVEQASIRAGNAICGHLARAWHARAVPSALAVLFALVAPAASAADPVPDGLHARPTLYWQSGDHRVDLGLEVRFREEAWSAFSDDTVWMNGTRTRVSARYAWRSRLALYAQFQDVRLHGLWPDASGPALTYRNANDGRDRAHGDDVRQLYFEVMPVEGSFVRAGRQDLRLGREVVYAETDWAYLKNSRVGERLVGTVGWSQVGRSFDGFAAGVDLGRHYVYGFAVRPTTGVYAAETGYRDLEDVQTGGLAWTLKRGTGLPNTEVSLFGIGYDDDRPVDEGGLDRGVELGTLGASIVGIYPVGPGKLDAILWAAGQFGDYDGLDHRAAAVLAEVGYRLPELPGNPWLRVGVNYASGDADPGDGDHTTFFNLLPTNHIYYGFADQIALQNIVDTFVQLRAQPHAMLALNLFVHWFQLADPADAKYGGTGVYDKKSFGFTAMPSRGYAHVGTEYDVVATLTPHEAVTIEIGFAWLDGGSLYRHSPSRDLQWGYASVELKY